MSPDLWSLYSLMLKSRLFEEAVTQLWKDGLISGEMHLGTGEEGIIAGIVSHLREGDSMALDHRSTAPLLMRGVDPVLILRELLGRVDGLCGGMGGHMHLFSKEHLAASSGIVGASGPVAAGFALAAQYLRPGAVTVAFFGDGSMNQGMLLEAMNLAAVWNLPVLFVCKDDQWAITTKSSRVTGGDLIDRAQGLGLKAVETDGREVGQVWDTAHQAIEKARTDEGPTFIRAQCVHLEGHFLGYPLLRTTRHPIREMPGMTAPLVRSFIRLEGAELHERINGLKIVTSSILNTLRDPRQDHANDPLARTRAAIESDTVRLLDIEDNVKKEIETILASALSESTP